MDVVLMKMDPEIAGTCTLDKFAGQIELLSFSHGVAMQITGDISSGERTSGRPNHQDFTVTKYLDQASPRLNEACCRGENFKSVEITVARNDSGAVLPLMRYTLKNVILSSISIGGGGGDKPVETVTMNYNQIAWDFHSQKQTNWDLGTNSAKQIE